MASNPWFPRVGPYFTYIVFLLALRGAGAFVPWAYPAVYVVQCGVVAWMLWRYRRLTPELTLRFHWLGPVTGVGLVVAWVALGYLSLGQWPGYLGGPAPSPQASELQKLGDTSAALMWTAASLHLLGMTLIVPLFEELCMRSAMLRGLSRARPTGRGLLQIASDMPLLDEVIQDRPAVVAANTKPPALTAQLQRTPLGKLAVFGVFASTAIFALGHAPRDYLGAVACGIVWCGLLWYTNRSPRFRDRPLGLGPVIWSHGITNALLWAYIVGFADWRFL